MDDAFDFVVVIDNGEIGEAGFVEFVENKGPQDFFVMDKNHFGFIDHEFRNCAVVETHDGRDAVAILAV